MSSPAKLSARPIHDLTPHEVQDFIRAWCISKSIPTAPDLTAFESVSGQVLLDLDKEDFVRSLGLIGSSFHKSLHPGAYVG